MKIKIDELEIEVSKCFNELNRKKIMILNLK